MDGGDDLGAGIECAPGLPFLDWFTRHATRELGCEWALVFERTGRRWEQSTLVAGGHAGATAGLGELTVPLAGAPCEQVYATGTFFHPAGSRQRFPTCGPLQALAIEACGGIALADRAGRPLGHVMLLDRRPCQDPERWLALLRRFEARLVGELTMRYTLREMEGLAAATHPGADDTLIALVRGFAHSLRAEAAFLCELLPQRADRVQSLAFAVDGEAQPCQEIDLAGTPCAITHRDGSYFVADEVQALHPSWSPLRELGARSYLGFRLDARNGKRLGHFGVLGRQPLSAAVRELPIVRLYVDRAAAELERRHLEAQRLADERRLAEARRRESLGVLAGGLARDLNNHLMAILGHSAVQQSVAATTADPELASHLAAIDQSVRRAATLVQRMIACAGSGVVNPAPLDLCRLVAEHVRLAAKEAATGVTVKTELSADLPIARGDAAALGQLVDALLHNALEATAARGGSVRVALRQVELDPMTRVALGVQHELENGTHLLLEVADDGAGMDRATLQRACEPFFTTKGEGRGLGLAVAHGLARAHGGALSLHAEPGRGVMARFLLPQEGPAMQVASAPPARRVAAATPRAAATKVVLIDDEPMVRSATKRMLERLGCHVRAEADGVAGLAAAQEPGAADWVLLDLTMPRMSGEEVFRRLRERRPELPIVLMTGYSAPEALLRFRGAGLAGFLQKPFGLEELERCLQETLPPSAATSIH